MLNFDSYNDDDFRGFNFDFDRETFGAPEGYGVKRDEPDNTTHSSKETQ